MIIYKDRVTEEDECMTDALKQEVLEGHPELIGFKCGKRKEKLGIDDNLIGGNASKEEQAEGLEDHAVTRFAYEDYGLEKIPFLDSKKSIKKYMMVYMNNVMKKLKDEKDHCKDAEKKFLNLKENGKQAILHFADMYDSSEWDVFAKEGLDMEAGNKCLFLGKWDDSGEAITLWCFKDSLIEVKS